MRTALLQRPWPTTSTAGSSPVDDDREQRRPGGQEAKNDTRWNIQQKIRVDVSRDGTVVDILHYFGHDDANNNDTVSSSSSSYHASWLWSNDPKRVHSTSGQRTSTPGEYRRSGKPTIVSARIIHCYNDASEDGIVHDAEEDSTEELQFPGPTMGDSCHPLPTYGRFRATPWMISNAISPSRGNPTTALGSYLRVEWKATTATKTISMYDMEWLKRFRYDERSRMERRKNTEVTPRHAIRKSGPPSWYSTFTYNAKDADSSTTSRSMHDQVDGLVHVDYHSIVHEDGKMQLLHHVFRDGAVIVTNTPSPYYSNECGGGNRTLSSKVEEDYPVAKVAKAMSGGNHLSHGSLYGDIFHVRGDDPGSNNVAYTSLELCPHQDLAYYESPPGMQLLHCVANGKGVIGGESLLIDAMAAAHRLREVRPESFEILARCPATFVKQRDGACMTYRTPHIVLASEGEVQSSGYYNIDREIVAVWWSPPFEGPVYLPSGLVDEYYEAYADFEQMLNRSVNNAHAIDYDDGLPQYAKEYTWERKLNPGEILVFNNRRMLHGRRGFSVAEGATFEEGQRHLVGCYTNIDDTLNSYRLLLRKRVEYETTTPILNVGNGTSIFP